MNSTYTNIQKLRELPIPEDFNANHSEFKVVKITQAEYDLLPPELLYDKQLCFLITDSPARFGRQDESVNLIEHRCSHCGASIEIRPNNGNVTCKYCGAVYSIF